MPDSNSGTGPPNGPRSVERELARANLPVSLEITPDGYVGARQAMEFVVNCARLEKLDDFGWHGASHLRVDHLSPFFCRFAAEVPILLTRLKWFLCLAHFEEPLVTVDIKSTGDETRITCMLPALGDRADRQYSEWVRVMGLVEIVRSSVGRDFLPQEITFQSKFQPCDDALEHFGNTRIVTGSETTSIVIPSNLRAAPCLPLHIPIDRMGDWSEPSSSTGKSNGAHRSFSSSLCAVIQPYLEDTYPSINLAAKISDTSVRSLQRRLREEGTTFSKVVQQARFSVAEEKLCDPDARIIDISMSCGYQDPAHFSRAFRRGYGMSPCEFRKARITA